MVRGMVKGENGAGDVECVSKNQNISPEEFVSLMAYCAENGVSRYQCYMCEEWTEFKSPQKKWAGSAEWYCSKCSPIYLASRN